MKKYNVGVIGYGWVATAHIPAINGTKQAQVTAVCSSRPQNPKELSHKYGSDISVYNDVDAMLANPRIHAVSVCSFPYQHTEHVIAAAKAGKHIIVEKPLALSWKDCQAMEAAVKKAKVKTCICFECRYSSQFLTTKAIIDNGWLGTLHYGEIDYYHGIGPWYGQFRWNVRKSAGGSSLLTAGCHALDALLLCMGSDATEVTSYDTKSKSKVFEPYEYTTSSVSILKFKNGSVGKCAAVVDCLQPYYFHTHLVGSEGSLLDNKFHSTKLGGLNKNAWSTLSLKPLDSGDVSDHPYLSQFQAFFDALDAGKEMPLTSLADALRSHKVIFAADKSAETGKTVKL
ncbi:MAG: Gfo/Idh/MocA family oxidoreductase [Verrucomicrobia bacterium]|nr:Gfo/Idh/MocA family oxidoreductase [Verrucomicrobiota bacterium]